MWLLVHLIEYFRIRLCLAVSALLPELGNQYYPQFLLGKYADMAGTVVQLLLLLLRVPYIFDIKRIWCSFTAFGLFHVQMVRMFFWWYEARQLSAVVTREVRHGQWYSGPGSDVSQPFCSICRLIAQVSLLLSTKLFETVTDQYLKSLAYLKLLPPLAC